MMTFEMVIEIFEDYLFVDKAIEVYRSRYGYVRVEFDRELRYCTGEICHSPKDLFDLLLSDYQSYMEVELTQGRRELTEDDEKQIRVLCKKYVDRLKEELMK